MPELPEVETIRRELAPLVQGRRITGVTLNWPKAVRQPGAEEFRRKITGKKISSLNRRGKYLIFRLDDGHSLIFHLKMTGCLIFQKLTGPVLPYSRTVFVLDNDIRLSFTDPRKFGSLWLVKDGKQLLSKLGPEPLEKSFTGKKFYEILQKRGIPIKTLLYDQAAIAGIGNMYADEALFLAKIGPMRPAKGLSPEEAYRLRRAVVSVLKKGIKNLGASIRNYRRPGNKEGRAHLEFNVAHRKGLPCPRCGALIERITLRGRGAFFCPKCQR